MLSAAKFLIVGGANTLAGLAVIYLAKWWMNLGDALANALGYGIGLCLSFFLNKSWTFGHEGPAAQALARFLLAFALAYVLNLGTVLFLINAIHLDQYLAQAAGIVPYTVFMYLASRHYAFR